MAADRSEAPAWVYPVETADTRAAWFLPEGMPALERVVDEDLGQPCLQYAEEMPLEGRTFHVDLDRSDLDGQDMLRFRWKLGGDPAQVRVTVHGYPHAGDRRNYYLLKRPWELGKWHEVWLDLQHDDDGGKSEAPEGKVRIAFHVKLWDMGELSEHPRVVLRLGDLRLVGHPLRLESDLSAVQLIADEQQVGQRYPLVITNRSDRPQAVRLFLEPEALREFSVDWPGETLTLEPGEKRQLNASITVSSERAEELPPLYSEQAGIFAAVEEAPGEVTTWHQGFLLYRLVGALPARPGTYPWFHAQSLPPLVAERVEHEPGARAAFEKLLKDARALLDISPVPPELLHGNPNDFFDRRTNSQLRFHGPGRIWSEKAQAYIEITTLPENAQRAAAYMHHQYLSGGAYKLALAAWLTGDRSYAEKARDILLAYAERYPSYPRRDEASLGFFSRVGWAMLQEAWWFDPIPEALDLLRGCGVLTEAEDRRIVEGLIVPAMLTIRAHRVVANQHAEVNAAYGRAALVAGRWDQAAEAFHGEAGIRAQWAREFDADGMTMERELPYHFAAIKPFAELAHALEAVGVHAFDPTFKRLFDAPLAYSMDQRLGRWAPYYEYAYASYRDPIYLPQIREARAGTWSLASLLSPTEVPPEDTGQRAGYANSILEGSGFTVLRSGQSPADLRAVTMNWGSPSHRQGVVLLNPEIHWRGHALNEQVKRIAYGYEQSAFSYTAAAGNSILVDGEQQSMLRADQVALLDGPTPAGRWTSPLHRPLYAGVAWSRTAAVCGDTVVLIDQLDSTEPRRFDWLTYLPGPLLSEGTAGVSAWSTFAPLLEQGEGYSYFQSPERAAIAPDRGGFDFAYQLGSKPQQASGHLSLLGSGGGLLRAQAYIHWHPRLVPVLLQRAENANSAWFLAAYTGRSDASSELPRMERVPVLRDGRSLDPQEAIGVRIRNEAGEFLVLTSAHPGPHDLAGQVMNGPLAVVRLEP